MSSNTKQNVIDCKNLGKRFYFYNSPLMRIVDLLLGVPGYHASVFEALKDVSFSVKKGESFGIVGRNGSGKSTLLKIISGVMAQTNGEINVNGRIASLLELGTGFHGEFTGRQNLVTNARMMGLHDDEIDEVLPRIIEFSELQHFIDRKVRTYSSGMLVRLAFSLSTHVSADILVVDEALAVGDASFQAKCIERIKKWVFEEGNTLLYVSHDPATVKMVCTQAILLSEGSMLGMGSPDVVLDHYNALLSHQSALDVESIKKAYQGNGGIVSGDQDVEIISIEMKDKANEPAKSVFTSGDSFILEVCFKTKTKTLVSPTIGFHMRDIRGYEVFGTNSFLLSQNLGECAPNKIHRACFRGKLSIGRGKYTLGIAMHEGRDHQAINYKWMDRVLTFEVIDDHHYMFDGVARLDNIQFGRAEDFNA